MMRRQWKGAIALGILLVGMQGARADVKPHTLFTDGAVLQRGKRVPVWGTARSGEKVTVQINGQAVSTTARDGRWMVWLKPMPAGGPYTLTIRGNNTLELKNVLVGEVYICSGQSNMEWPMTLTENAESAIAQSGDPQLRLFTVPKNISDTPVTDFTSSWNECGPKTVPGFSAVGYYFGRNLRQALNVPVGLINTSWGGTPAEAWTERAMLESDPKLKSILANYALAKENYQKALPTYQQAMEAYRQALEKSKQDGTPPPKQPNAPYNPENQNRPSGLYNAMIAPLQPYALRGAIWYQGESNAGRAYEYQTLFPTMIDCWRKTWGQGDFPFFFVQLAPFMKIETEPKESAWAELREAQRLTSLNTPKTGVAVITDVGDEVDIHPRKKQPVGERLALLARATVYGEKIEHYGPTYAGLKIEGEKAIVSFRHAKGGLVAQGGALTGFTIAGADRKFYNATAVAQGEKVIVTCPQVPNPVAVRFGWANFPVVNLYNKDGLPASPFRTDDFPLTTQPK